MAILAHRLESRGYRKTGNSAGWNSYWTYVLCTGSAVGYRNLTRNVTVRYTYIHARNNRELIFYATSEKCVWYQTSVLFNTSNLQLRCMIVYCTTNRCIWNTCVTWQSNDYKHPEDDTIVSKHIGVW